MAKVILICGKLCCGKTTYAGQFKDAILLSVDEIMLSIFGQHAGEKHDEYAKGAKEYLLAKSLELLEQDINVVLDWGFWTKQERDLMRGFYDRRNLEMEFHYLDISDETWKARISKRNHAIEAGETNAYFVDENLAIKFLSRFEKPEKKEIDVWITEK